MSSDSSDEQEGDGFDSESDSSDRELQIALRDGLIKPGLVVEARPKRTFINNTQKLNEKLQQIRVQLSWTERLDITTPPAAAAPGTEDAEDNLTETELAENDFKRELSFYRQAQAAVLEGVSLLKKHNIPYKRPDDYYAEMAKSDAHMQKVREKILSKEAELERREKIRKLRTMKKFGKQVQTEVLQKRQKEKREMLDSVKKFRKGKLENLDFLDGNSKQKPNGGQGNKNPKRDFRDKKFGFGGRKKRGKYNTGKSAADLSGFNVKKNATAAGKKKKEKGGDQKKRPGKFRRQKMKGRRK